MIKKLLPDWLKIFYYKIRGRIPWSKGYNTYKWHYIKKALSDRELMARFSENGSLPFDYGKRLDVRVVEYPWLFSRLSKKPEKLLDAGSSLNYRYILELLKSFNKEITIINLNPEEESFPEKKISYIFADMRKMPFKDNYFDIIACVSTFQHIGMDNTGYLNDKRYREENLRDFEKALFEFKRTLKKEGKVFITVPFGKYQNFGRLQQFNSEMIERIIKVFQPSEYNKTFYQYKKGSWVLSSEKESKNSEYFNAKETKYFNSKSNLDFDKYGAAASRAVACLEMVK